MLVITEGQPSVLTSLWVQHELVRVRPALARAIWDMPLIRIVAGRTGERDHPTAVRNGTTTPAGRLRNVAHASISPRRASSRSDR